jgi:hypothetical protein
MDAFGLAPVVARAFLFRNVVDRHFQAPLRLMLQWKFGLSGIDWQPAAESGRQNRQITFFQ